MRAAASSIASGNPSRRRQISATIAAFEAVNSKSPETAVARSVKSRTAAEAEIASRIASASCAGSASGETGKSCSTVACSTAWLVTMILTLGQRLSR